MQEVGQQNNDRVATLREKRISLGGAGLFCLKEIKAGSFAEPKSGFDAAADVQLFENQQYEYQFEGQWNFDLPDRNVVIPSSFGSGDRGLIQTGIHVGHLRFLLKNQESGELRPLTLEVQSKILRYQDDFKQMVADVVGAVTDLQMQLNAPSSGRVRPNQESSKTRQQRLFFLLGLVCDEKFQRAVRRVIECPNRRWREIHDASDIRRAGHMGAAMLRSFASANNRIPLPEGHGLRERMVSVPRRIDRVHKEETIDTPENRFVKYVLGYFRHALEAFEQELQQDGAVSLLNDIRRAQQMVNTLLGHGFFREVGVLQTACLNSPLLQRKEGYREILTRWVQYRLGCNMNWDGMEDVYHAGQRNIATLYEYWCFFKLLAVVKDKFGVKIENMALVERKDCQGDDLPLRLVLKSGKPWSCPGIYEKEGIKRKLNVRFSYNRTFRNSGKKESWTLELRPDYTFSFWPMELSEMDAEKLDLITHVHFDAKYKARDLSEVLKDDVTPDDSAENNGDAGIADVKRSLDVKRLDLIKMHCYRDAIYRTGGAYVLYPGTEDKPLRGFSEIIPGLGAFPLRPNHSGDDEPIKKFLDDLLTVLCDRVSQWENYTYQKYRVFKKGQDKVELPESMPPEVDEEGKRRNIDLDAQDDPRIFLRDKPIKGVQACSVEAGVYPVKAADLHDNPARIKWILLSLSNNKVRLLKVKGYVGKYALEGFKAKFSAFADYQVKKGKGLKEGIAFESTDYHVWRIEEVKES